MSPFESFWSMGKLKKYLWVTHETNEAYGIMRLVKLMKLWD